MELREAELEELDVESVLGFAEQMMLNGSRFWVDCSLSQKQRVQKVLFPEGVRFSEGVFGTSGTSSIFNTLHMRDARKREMASPTGFEPVLPA